MPLLTLIFSIVAATCAIAALAAVLVSAANNRTDQRLEHIRRAIERQSDVLDSKLNDIRATVDEKLQKTLEDRISRSFQLVSQRLEQVYKGLGEMQALAGGVGDLKRVLSGVKTRGVLGEIQLGAILEQLLSPEQYAVNVATKPGSNARVEFAVKMPGAGDDAVWLPIDSKFPYDRYHALCEAYDAGDGAAAELRAKELVSAVRASAKEIRDKYIDPPNTTDFGILFLPFEGLYAEVVRRGMVESLSRDFKISVVGPTTMGAFLNSLQIGFRTLAIQKRSGEVWGLLGQVRTEFERFELVLAQTQKKLTAAGDELEKLVGVRTRGILKSLRGVEKNDDIFLDDNV
ncbi:hypothetical protein FACS1894217_09300 [Clostridia bacterium]|nr:hypothetical protein FACS1894217_09300 [Clostridia bacterium]